MGIARFENASWLWLLLVLLPMAAYYVYKVRKGRPAIRISTVDGLVRLPRTAKYYLRHLPFVLRCLAVAALVVALARPQAVLSDETVETEGIDIVMALDISGSMLTRDLKPDRITAARETASRFILDRPDDRIGLVVFAGESFTQSPLTTDRATLVNLLNRVGIGQIRDGTAIGNGLATAVNRLRDSKAKSKVVILLTDGVNNSGQIAPVTAADIAKTYGIRVYTIGVGTRGMAPTPFLDPWGGITYQPAKVEIDEDILRRIASETGGRYFRATDNRTLASVYEEIDALEKTKVEVNRYERYRELYAAFVWAALLLAVAEVLFRYLYLRQIP